MKIIEMRLHTVEGNLKAFFKVETSEGFLLDCFKVMNGTNGLFVSPPAEKGSDGKYYERVKMDRDLRQKLTDAALSEFKKLP